MNTRGIIYGLATALTLGAASSAVAQDDDGQVEYTPKHMTEIGINGGFAFLSSDLDLQPGYGAGIHVRRAFDHIFSIRVDGNYMRFNSDAPSDNPDAYLWTNVQTTMFSGDAQAVMTLNNFTFNKPVRKVNIYVFGGPGVGGLTIKGDNQATDATAEDILEIRDIGKYTFYATGGAGVAFRVSPRFNVGIEHKVMVPFTKSADLLDGFRNEGGTVTSYRDIPNYTNVRLNFNIGNQDELAEPLYWVNPLNQVIDELTELKARPVLDLTDTDSDGIIDMLDQETDTPEGAPVDTRGVALDSDSDGVPDYEDGEPYSPPGMTVDAKGIAAAPGYLTQPEVEDLIASKLTDYENSTKGNMEDWFLPMIHFGYDSYTVRTADYGGLKNVAEVMKANPDIQVAVQGFTDKTASEEYNKVLSYNRSKAAVEYISKRYGIDSSRLVILYDGEEDVLVPTNGRSFMNRRVEFRVAGPDDKAMAEPQGPRAGKGTFFEGSKDAGY